MKPMTFLLFILAWFPHGNPVIAEESASERLDISITTGVEEGQKVLVATVKLNGEAIEGAKVAFFVKRTFGLLKLGSEETLDDGTAVVPFPEGLPGGPSGKLELVAKIESPAEYAAQSGAASVEGGTMVPMKDEPFPRALWSPKAPISLLLTIVILLTGVWSAYAYVFGQLLKIGHETSFWPKRTELAAKALVMLLKLLALVLAVIVFYELFRQTES